MRAFIRAVVFVSVAIASTLGSVTATAGEAAQARSKFPKGDVKFLGNDYMALTNGKGEIRFRWFFPDRQRWVSVVQYQTRINGGTPTPFMTVGRDRLLPTKSGWSHGFTLSMKTSGGCRPWYPGSTYEVTLVAMEDSKPGTQRTIAYKRFTVPLVCKTR